jgi:prepilin-type processing-associated H-X9-DG protein
MLVVMAGVLIPALHKARQRSNEGLCAMQMGQIGNALQTYGINHKGRLPSAGGPTGRWLTYQNEPPKSNSRALFRLLRQKYLHSPVVFQCPSVGGASFVMESDMRDFPRPEHISYSFQYSLDDHGVSSVDPAIADRSSEMAILADQSPLFTGGVFHPENLDAPHSDNHPDRQNVLFLDGHVMWFANSTVGVDGDHIFLVGDVRDYDGDERPTGPADSFLLPAHPGR